MNLLKNIVNCPNVKHCLDKNDEKHPCAKIIGNQKAYAYDNFTVPEPWSGDLENAPILFLCPSPVSIENEEYPTYSWPDYIISDFFVNRFGGGLKFWVKNQLYPLLKDGTHSGEWVRYWAEVRKRTIELLGKREIKAGIDYAIYPLIHCKAREVSISNKTLEECLNRYFLEAIHISNAKVIICLGKDIGIQVRKALDIPKDRNPYGPLQIGKRKRYILYLQNPNARRVPHSLKKLISQEELQELRTFLKDSI